MGVSKIKQAVFLLGPSLVLIILLWLPFGFHMGGTIEEWGLLELYTQQGPFFFAAGPHSPLLSHQVRPLMTTLWAIAYSLDPNSWWFWHVELMLSLLIKGGAMAWVGFYLTGSRVLSLISGMLLIVWPADTMQMAFRASGIGLAEGLIVLSAALLVSAYLTRRKLIQAGFSVLSGTCFIISTWTYELAFLLAPLPFFLMFAREGASGMFARIKLRRMVSLIWIFTILFYLSYVLIILFTVKKTYQQELMGNPLQILTTTRHHFFELFSKGYMRSLVGGWLDTARIVFQDYHTHLYLLSTWAIVAIMLYASNKEDTTLLPIGKHLAKTKILVIGLLLVALGYAPFLAIPSHLAISQRTFIFTAPGAVLVFLALLAWTETFSRRAVLIVAGTLITFGLAQQLYQFDSYQQIYDQQRHVLQSILQQVPDVPAGKTLVLLDGSQRVNHTWMQEGTIQSSLSYLYNKPVKSVQVCLMPWGTWQSRDQYARPGFCQETKDTWIFKSAKAQEGTSPNRADLIIKKSDTVTAVINRDGSIPKTPQLKQYQSELLAAKTVVGKRYVHLLLENNWPVNFHLFRSAKLPTNYQWDFGHRWSIEQPIQGSGWREAEWKYSPFRQVSAAWINQPHASLLFELAPIPQNYQLNARIQKAANPEAQTSLKIKINEVDLPVIWTSKYTFHVFVPRGLLYKGSNEIDFEAPVNKHLYDLSLQVDWIKLQPTSA